MLPGLIVSILVIQLVAILGAVLTSYASSKFGNIKTLIVINFFWMALCFYAYFMETPMQFYIAASFVGLVMGGVQALARSTYSKFLPVTEDTTSYFSFYDVAEKIGIVIGMVIFATIDQITGSMRNAILFLVIFFLADYSVAVNESAYNFICKKLTRCLQNPIISNGGFCKHGHAQTNSIDASRSKKDLAALANW